MAIIDHEAELHRAGANITGLRSQLVFTARRYPLGAIGAIIVLTFVLTAVFANFIAPFDPTSTDSKSSLARPGKWPQLRRVGADGPVAGLAPEDAGGIAVHLG